jgi:hypothetical protein
MKNLILLTLLFTFPFCKKGPDNLNVFVLNDTTNVSYQDCLTDSENQIYLCLDSVSKESRCPLGVECFWAGYAEVKFKFNKADDPPVYFYLATLPPLKNELIIEGYKIRLIDLKPWPVEGHAIMQKEYTARIIVSKII